MTGFLKITKLKDNTIERLSYYTLKQIDPRAMKDKLKSLYNPYRHKKIILQCMCNTKPIDMRIAYIEHTDTYYLSSYPKQAENHHTDCYFHRDKSLSSNGEQNKKSVEEDNEGNYLISLNAHDYKKTNSHKVNGDSEANSGIGWDAGVGSNKLSTHQLIKIIVAESWNTYVHFDGEEQYPNMKRIFEQIYNYTLLKYYIATKISLKNSLFYKGKIGRIFYLEQELGTKTQPFVIFQLKSFNLTEEDTYDINMINPISGDTYTFTAKRDVVERSKQKNRVDSDYCIVGGFVKSSGKGKNPEFISLGVLPVNQNGVVIESSYEKKLYDLLCEKKRLFQRPINAKYHPKWDGLVPDGLLIDTQPHTIIEVFGMSEDHIDYHLHREYKIKHYESIVDSYRLWYWDAFKDSNIPTLPLQR